MPARLCIVRSSATVVVGQPSVGMGVGSSSQAKDCLQGRLRLPQGAPPERIAQLCAALRDAGIPPAGVQMSAHGETIFFEHTPKHTDIPGAVVARALAVRKLSTASAAPAAPAVPAAQAAPAAAPAAPAAPVALVVPVAPAAAAAAAATARTPEAAVASVSLGLASRTREAAHKLEELLALPTEDEAGITFKYEPSAPSLPMDCTRTAQHALHMATAHGLPTHCTWPLPTIHAAMAIVLHTCLCIGTTSSCHTASG